MSIQQSIIRTIENMATKAFNSNKAGFTAYNAGFLFEHVNGNEYRIITQNGKDSGIRFIDHGRNLEFVMA